MKKWHIYPLALLLIVLSASCSNDEPDGESIFSTEEVQRNDFDKWLLENYVGNYNIDFKYRMEDIETDYTHNLVPADFNLSVKLAKIVKHVWLESYDEAAGIDFTRANAPKIIHVVGSAYWDDNQYTLGTAEGGLKVTLYLGNWLDPTNTAQLNKYYFKTMHHEFAHILHQKKTYPVEFNEITNGTYSPTGWINRTLAEVAPLGYVTPYASSEPVEDIAEITATYLTYTDAQWAEVWAAAGDTGTPLIQQKIEIMKNYMKTSWGIDVDLLRNIISRRCNEISTLDLDHI